MTIHLTILEFKELCGDDCQVSYCYKNGLNVTILDFKNDFLKKQKKPERKPRERKYESEEEMK